MLFVTYKSALCRIRKHWFSNGTLINCLRLMQISDVYISNIWVKKKKKIVYCKFRTLWHWNTIAYVRVQFFVEKSRVNYTKDFSKWFNSFEIQISFNLYDEIRAWNVFSSNSNRSGYYKHSSRILTYIIVIVLFNRFVF